MEASWHWRRRRAAARLSDAPGCAGSSFWRWRKRAAPAARSWLSAGAGEGGAAARFVCEVAAGGKGGLGVGWRVLRAGGAHVAWAGWGQEGRRGVRGGRGSAGGMRALAAAQDGLLRSSAAPPFAARDARAGYGTP